MFNERLNKKLVAELLANGIEAPTPLQLKCIPKINGGFDIIAIAPDGSGKTSTVVISTIQKLTRAVDDPPPRALILAGTTEKVLAMKEQFTLLTKETGLRVECAYEEGKIDEQSGAIYEGTDVVIGTPKRILEIYFSKNLNLNKIKLFVIDDAELMIKHGFQGPIDRLGLSLPKCQHLVFTNELNEKIQKLISKFIIAPQVIEIPAS
ncbi:MAG: DEAD/DEAH box helicase [Bacteroidia bacterium]